MYQIIQTGGSMAKINKPQFFTSLRAKKKIISVYHISERKNGHLPSWCQSETIHCGYSLVGFHHYVKMVSHFVHQNCGSHNLVWILTTAVLFKIMAEIKCISHGKWRKIMREWKYPFKNLACYAFLNCGEREKKW